jgi:hypothetical protein
MTIHIPIQNPGDYDKSDLMRFAEKLFSPLTQPEELDEICMTLAHIPSKEAQELLNKFRESSRAGEVQFLEAAIDEGTYLYLSPTNDRERHEFLVLKVIQETTDAIIDLDIKYSELDLHYRKTDIKHQATQALVTAGALHPDEILGFDDAKLCLESDMEKLKAEIDTQEKLIKYLKTSITTEKYKNVSSSTMQHINFD